MPQSITQPAKSCQAEKQVNFAGIFGQYPRHMAEPMSVRALERINAAIANDQFTKRALGKLCGYKDTGINLVLSGRRPLRAKVIEAAATLMRVDPAELVKADGVEMTALDVVEAEMIRAARSWPVDVRNALARFLSYFAGETAKRKAVRDAAYYFGEIGPQDQADVMGYMRFRHEGVLPRGARIAPELRVTKAAEASPQPRRLT